MKKILSIVIGAMLIMGTMFSFAGCAGGAEMKYYDQLTKDKDYNRSLFYRNDLVVKAADPSVIYVTEGDQKGYFYMYATSDEIGASGYQSWRSKDLVNWECTGVAFQPDRASWGIQNYWAPECIYYKAPGETTGKYYLFYNAWNDKHPNKYHALGLAVSDNPQGPFVQWTGTNADDRVVGITDAYVDASLFPAGMEIKGQPFIDVSPFIDDDGKIYLYFVHDIQGGTASSAIWGMELKDMFTPDYASAKQITKFGFDQVDNGTSISDDTNRTNEAPFVYKKGGKYYMTYSTSQYFYADYSIGQAVADSPLGAFKKVEASKGGHFMTYKGAPGSDEYNYDFMAGTGHHSFVPVGDELYIVYHAFVDRWYATLGQGRSIAADKVSFINNGEQDIMYVNGPSYSLQPLPAAVSGYKNIIGQAKSITATNEVSGNGVEYLKDGIYKNHDFDYIKEFKANGNTTITITFDKQVDVRAIMIYNAFNYSESFDKIKKITFSGGGDRFINNLGYDPIYKFVDSDDATNSSMRPGGSAIAEFNEIKTNKIVIEIEKSGTLAISDIVILGKGA